MRRRLPVRSRLSIDARSCAKSVQKKTNALARSIGTPVLECFLAFYRFVDQFAGALSKKKATKGIFITTSSFTKDALVSVKDYSSRIILIDGVQLADYMIDYNVGVSIASTYEIK